jgi:hypothetical protein
VIIIILSLSLFPYIISIFKNKKVEFDYRKIIISNILGIIKTYSLYEIEKVEILSLYNFLSFDSDSEVNIIKVLIYNKNKSIVFLFYKF